MKLPKQPTDSQTTFWALWGDKDKKVNSEGKKKEREKAKQEGRGNPDWTEREQNNSVTNKLREEMSTEVIKDI